MTNIKLAEITTIQMYRDCLKATRIMASEPSKQKNIAKHFRLEFEKQRNVFDKDKHEEFRFGIVRLLSNYMLYDIKKQYLENPNKFKPVNINDPKDQAAEEEELENQDAASPDYKPPFI
eukprot:403368913